MGGTQPLARHIFSRLAQLRCRSVHGVPGDFFLRALDHIEPCGLKWIGNANELCAGYAADGYARAASQVPLRDGGRGYQPSMGAFMTTYGVGELSAINALAGSFAEQQSVVQIVGAPSRQALQRQDHRRLVHHSIPGKPMSIYSDLVLSFVCDRALLQAAEDGEHAVEMIDRALISAVKHSKPVYVSLPSDMVELPVPVTGDDLSQAVEISDASQDHKQAVTAIVDIIQTSDRPLIIADGLTYPFGQSEGLNALVKLTNIPAMSFTSGKGIINESLPSWDPALPNTTDYSRSTDLVLIFGQILSDTNTARWSAVPDSACWIDFALHRVSIHTKQPDGTYKTVDYEVSGTMVLESLVSGIKGDNVLLQKVQQPQVSDKSGDRIQRTTPGEAGSIKQDDLWPIFSNYLQSNDTLLLANGTPLIGGRALHLPDNCAIIASPIWNAIGSMLPAAQGVAAAKRDHNLPGRTILFEGDGSFQVTCQAISDIIRYELDVTVFIINNAGYTYERWLNGMEASYNDVPAWRYVEAASFFGADVNDPRYPIYAKKVETWGQFIEMLHDEKACDGKGLKIIDVVMDPQDVPSAAIPGLKRSSEALRST